MPSSYFLDIWGNREEAYSALIAQTLVLSESFRELLEERLRLQKGTLSFDLIEKEKVLSNDAGRIDVYIKCENGLLIGIENKKWAGLQESQLHRYANALQKQSNNNYRLIFLAPTKYPLLEEQKPKGLLIITYREVIDWLRIGLSKYENHFEKRYFEQLLAYLEDLEMKPLQSKEIESLLGHFSCEKKLRAILDELKAEGEYIENSERSGYMLFARLKYGNIPFYVGFRFGTNWYHNAPLLNKSPECIVYIKDIWDDSEQKQKNDLVKDIFEKLNKETHLEQDNSISLDYYPRKGKEECRLSIRRSLGDFANKDLIEIITWFKNTISLFERYLQIAYT